MIFLACFALVAGAWARAKPFDGLGVDPMFSLPISYDSVANITVGTPPQLIRVLVSWFEGVAALWLNAIS
jgi:hypothetical protein